MHGWCAEKENRGKGGSGKGKIGAGVGSCRSMDPVGISSGSRRDPVGHQFLHFWAPLLASRDFGSTSRWDPALALTKLCFLSRPIPYILVLYSDGFRRTSEKSQMFNLRGVDGAALIFGNW